MKSEKRNAIWMVLFLVIGMLAMPVAQVSYIAAFVVLLGGCIGFSAMMNRIAHDAEAHVVEMEKKNEHARVAA